MKHDASDFHYNFKGHDNNLPYIRETFMSVNGFFTRIMGRCAAPGKGKFSLDS